MGKKSKDVAHKETLLASLTKVGAVILLRKLIGFGWTKATGRKPPIDLADREVTLPEVLVWSLGTALIIDCVRFALTRATTRRAGDTSQDDA